ncbi:electron transport complex protein RnfG [Maridesulfovibrio ferrireducens]|uniref:Ion-translocating oxidoreductase complex subunit G n=1 Tax=Maridesulfovibrio ferrireducens TaxID=246191 RepID=A0A1G9HTB7_9BACT|nr:RnfABCDGE type electron transport complex subunit G [Maridesulfovibrio ferrireducens]SDL15803.1 electron transport complex protein RnfG [Maridesulfovibrio ferrireducens]
MNETLKMIVVLSLICGLSGFTLASLKDATNDKIEEQVMTYVQGPAISNVLIGFDNSPVKDRKKFDIPGTDKQVTVFPAIKDGKLFGVALESAAKGYGGNVGVMVGFNIDGVNLSGIGITTMKETPGIGARVAKHGFTKQFRGHPASVELSSKGGDIDGIAGATISSTASVEAVKKAINIFAQIKPQITAAWIKGS